MTATVVELCRRARPEFACLGDLGGPLLAVVGVIERVGATRGCDALADPGFALDVLTAANGHGTRRRWAGSSSSYACAPTARRRRVPGRSRQG
jgi:hypothetical protein